MCIRCLWKLSKKSPSKVGLETSTFHLRCSYARHMTIGKSIVMAVFATCYLVSFFKIMHLFMLFEREKESSLCWFSSQMPATTGAEPRAKPRPEKTPSWSPTGMAGSQVLELLPVPPRLCASWTLELRAEPGQKPRYSSRAVGLLTAAANTYTHV